MDVNQCAETPDADLVASFVQFISNPEASLTGEIKGQEWRQFGDRTKAALLARLTTGAK